LISVKAYREGVDMNLIWRFLWVILFSRFSSPIDLFDTCFTSFRVMPTDVDLLMHLNNGRYFSLMDIARMDFMIRNNIFPILKKNKIYPVVGSEMIRFKKSIHLFKRFQITTRLLGWDEKYFYIVQHFKCHHEVCAISLVKACMLQVGGNRIVNTNEILELIGVKHDPLIMPDWVNDWQRADQEFNDEVMKDMYPI
jgi:acyl-CoA thioesterase FadM